MNFATQETTNLLLVVLTLVVVAQFVLLIGVLVAARSAAQRAKLAFDRMTGGDVDRLHARFHELLTNVEHLVTRSNRILDTVDRGTQNLGTAAALVSSTAQRAMNVSSFEAHAVSTAVRTALRWFLESPWKRRSSGLRPVQPAATSRELEPVSRTS